MENLILKLEEFVNKLVTELDTLKNQKNDYIDPQHFQILQFKVRYRIEQMKDDIQSKSFTERANGIIREDESQNTESLVELQLANLKDLSEKIVNEFDSFKHYNTKNLEPSHIDNNLIEFLFKIRNEIDEMKINILSERDMENNKAHAMVKLQTLGTLIACHIINLDNNNN